MEGSTTSGTPISHELSSQTRALSVTQASSFFLLSLSFEHARRVSVVVQHAKPQPPPPDAPSSSSVFTRLRVLAFSAHSLAAKQLPLVPSSEPLINGATLRPTRSLSDASCAPPHRPLSGSRDDGRTDSTYTASSTASTSQSSASTNLTTPDSTSSPGLSPSNSIVGAKKLRKRRPPVAPSAYPFPPGAQVAALGRSKSTPNGLGQRSPKNRLWATSVSDARKADGRGSGSQASLQDPPAWPPSVSRTLLPLLLLLLLRRISSTLTRALLLIRHRELMASDLYKK